MKMLNELQGRADVKAALAGYKRVCEVYVKARAERDRLTRRKRPNPVHLLLAKQKAAALNEHRKYVRAWIQNHFAAPENLDRDLGDAVMQLCAIPLCVQIEALEEVRDVLDNAKPAEKARKGKGAGAARSGKELVAEKKTGASKVEMSCPCGNAVFVAG